MKTDTEQDIRISILNSLLTTPHRDLDKVIAFHTPIVEKDPIFYGHLGAWYYDKGAIRDHKELFISCLALSNFEGHREAACTMLQDLPPYEVARVIGYIKGVSVKDKTGKAKVIGLFKNVPRVLKTAVSEYLASLERNPVRFDGAVLSARSALKGLYAGLRIKHSDRVQAILFDNNPPADSRLSILKAIAKANSAEQAELFIKHRIPYKTACTMVKEMTPTILLALINAMSSQELINNLNSLKQRGVMDNPDLKALIDSKLKSAKTNTRVSAYKAKVAAEVVGDAELAETLSSITESRVKASGAINKRTLLAIDKSGSMDKSIEVGKQIAALISTICKEPPVVYAFDTAPFVISSAGTSLSSWEKAFKGIIAQGGTSCGIALDAMTKNGQVVDQIIMVTDQAENQAPFFRDAYIRYSEKIGFKPNVVIVNIPPVSTRIEVACRSLGVEYSVFTFSGDYYSLPNLVPMLSAPSMAELVMEILEYPLPKRVKHVHREAVTQAAAV
jgi:hypothetical protein